MLAEKWLYTRGNSDMWYVITFIVGMLFGAAAVICFACLAISSMADEEERELMQYH